MPNCLESATYDPAKSLSDARNGTTHHFQVMFDFILSLGQWFSTDGSQPTFGSRALTFGSPKPVFYTIIVIYWSPNCEFLYFVGH